MNLLKEKEIYSFFTNIILLNLNKKIQIVG